MPRPLLIFSQSDYLIWIVAIKSHNGKQCRSRSVGFFFRSQLIWICTVCKGRVYPGSAGQGLRSSHFYSCPLCFLFLVVLVLFVLCGTLWLLAVFFHILFCSLSYCCVLWTLSCIVITLCGKRGLVVLLLFGLWLVFCLS